MTKLKGPRHQVTLSQHGRECFGTGDVRGSKTHHRSASHSTAPTVPSTEDDDVDDLDEIEIHPQGSSHSTGGFSQGRASLQAIISIGEM